MYIEHAKGRAGGGCSPGQIRDRHATVCAPVCILLTLVFSHTKDKGRYTPLEGKLFWGEKLDFLELLSESNTKKEE